MASIRSTKRQSERGFSVLEAIAAIALIAVAFLPLLALQSQLARTALSIERAERVVTARKSALALLRVTNPAQKPTGSEQVGEATLYWTAEPVGETRPVRDQSGGESRFVAQLYKVEARLSFADGQENTFEVDVIGWRAVRPAGSGF